MSGANGDHLDAVDHRESAIALFRHHYAHDPPRVMNEIVGIKELVPLPNPAVPIVSAERHDPMDRIVGCGFGAF